MTLCMWTMFVLWIMWIMLWIMCDYMSKMPVLHNKLPFEDIQVFLKSKSKLLNLTLLFQTVLYCEQSEQCFIICIALLWLFYFLLTLELPHSCS